MQEIAKIGFMLSLFILAIRKCYQKTKGEKEHFVDWLAGQGFMITIALAMGFYILYAGIGLLHPYYDPDATDPYF